MQNVKIIIRKGNYSDVDWIAKLLEQGISDGHFHKSLKNIKEFIIKVINNEPIPFVELRGKVDYSKNFNFKLLVAEIGSDPASFLILKSGYDGDELHLACTKKTYKRMKCFKKLVSFVLENTNIDTRVYARCYKKSTYALDALMGMGFVVTKNGDPVELDLLRQEEPNLLKTLFNLLRKKPRKSQ